MAACLLNSSSMVQRWNYWTRSQVTNSSFLGSLFFTVFISIRMQLSWQNPFQRKCSTRTNWGQHFSFLPLHLRIWIHFHRAFIFDIRADIKCSRHKAHILPIALRAQLTRDAHSIRLIVLPTHRQRNDSTSMIQRPPIQIRLEQRVIRISNCNYFHQLHQDKTKYEPLNFVLLSLSNSPLFPPDWAALNWFPWSPS